MAHRGVQNVKVACDGLRGGAPGQTKRVRQRITQC